VGNLGNLDNLDNLDNREQLVWAKMVFQEQLVLRDPWDLPVKDLVLSAQLDRKEVMEDKDRKEATAQPDQLVQSDPQVKDLVLSVQLDRKEVMVAKALQVLTAQVDQLDPRDRLDPLVLMAPRELLALKDLRAQQRLLELVNLSLLLDLQISNFPLVAPVISQFVSQVEEAAKMTMEIFRLRFLLLFPLDLELVGGFNALRRLSRRLKCG